MDALIYTAMSGADRALRAQQVHANNLANIETGGFRANLEVSTAQPLQNGYGYDDRHMTQTQSSADGTRSRRGHHGQRFSRGTVAKRRSLHARRRHGPR